MSEGTTTRPSVRFQRLAEQVADDLRRRILLGDLADGTALPVEEHLREQYPVSKPTLREAMRVLEAEGLVSVRRGSIGGAVVHRPQAANVAYTMGLVLSSHRTTLAEVGAALREVEPACAAACAERADRDEVVVPVLRQLQADALAVVDDLVAVTTASRQFHEAIVELCGNGPLTIMAGALEALWSTHESDWAHRVGEVAEIPRHERLEALAEHARLIDLIESGDADGARRLSATHLLTSQTYPSGAGGAAGAGGAGDPSGAAAAVVDPEAVRRSFVAGIDAASEAAPRPRRR